VPECFKETTKVNRNQWKSVKFDSSPAVPKTPNQSVFTKFGMGDDVGDIYPYAKFNYGAIRGFCSLPHPASVHGRVYKVTRASFFCFSVSLQPSLLYRFLRSIRQITPFRKDVPFGVPRKFYISTHPLQKAEIFGQFLTGQT